MPTSKTKNKYQARPYSREDLNSAISHPKTNADGDRVNIVMYNEKGKCDAKLNVDNASAVVYMFKDNPTYKVKTLKTGEFFNPAKLSFNYGLDKRDRNSNEALFRLKTVSVKSFNNYIQFLIERHDSLLIMAERAA